VTEQPIQPARMVELRVLTYNVRGVRAGMAGIARVITAARPDIVCVQEAPVGLRWRGRTAELARRSGLYVVTGGRPAAGNLMLCAARVDRISAADSLLSRTPGLAVRGCTSAVLRVGRIKIGVIGVHFGLRAPERHRHAAEVAAIADRLRSDGATAVLIAGDLNASPSAAEWEPLYVRLRDTALADAAWGTFPAHAPTARIDVVLAEPDVPVVSCEVLEHPDVARASDHRPVLAVLRLTSRSGSDSG
jgi:endonuclease/exonuclease/phosphatase family metal-dependent hydrolase